LCDPKATTAVYMPLGTLRDLTTRLLAAGMEVSRPIAAVFNATRPDQRTIVATVATIAARVEAEEPSGPCVLLIGEVLRASRQLHVLVQGQSASA
jgi:uroporphyrin-III C-methyltransferase / precorrin-2 dehydrogenase / sirohydrochlorin ferrochelatase